MSRASFSQLWRVRVGACTVHGTDIAPIDVRIPAASEGQAIQLGAELAAQRAGGIPPWRPFYREIERHTRAEQ